MFAKLLVDQFISKWAQMSANIIFNGLADHVDDSVAVIAINQEATAITELVRSPQNCGHGKDREFDPDREVSPVNGLDQGAAITRSEGLRHRTSLTIATIFLCAVPVETRQSIWTFCPIRKGSGSVRRNGRVEPLSGE